MTGMQHGWRKSLPVVKQNESYGKIAYLAYLMSCRNLGLKCSEWILFMVCPHPCHRLRKSCIISLGLSLPLLQFFFFFNCRLGVLLYLCFHYATIEGNNLFSKTAKELSPSLHVAGLFWNVHFSACPKDSRFVTSPVSCTPCPKCRQISEITVIIILHERLNIRKVDVHWREGHVTKSKRW